MANRSAAVTSVTLAAFFLTCACHGAVAQTTSVRQSPDTVSTGLRMVIVPNEPASGSSVPIARFRVTIENDGDKDLIVNLGYMFGNGQVMLPTSLELIHTDPAGRTRELRFFSPHKRSRGMNPGKLDDYILALSSGATYGFSLDLDEYWCPATKEYPVRLSKGQHRIQARLNAGAVRSSTGDLALLRLWLGTVQSSSVSFGVSESGAISR
jgi:hypothetical protein